MGIKFTNKNLQELYTKGFSVALSEIPKEVSEKFLKVIYIAQCVSSTEEIITPPPYKGLVQADGSLTILLCDDWWLDFTLEISDDENNIIVLSLKKIYE